MTVHAAQRWLMVAAVQGCGLWLITFFVQHIENFLIQAEYLFLFGVAVVTPLSLRLILQPDRHGKLSPLLVQVIRLQPFVALVTCLTLLLPFGLQTTLLSAVWLIQGVLIAFHGMERLLSRSVIAPEEICIDAALLYTPISGIWWVAYSAGYSLLTFDPVLVLLTAVHFVYISLGAQVFVGMVGRRLVNAPRGRIYRTIAWLVIGSPLLVAIGISTTQFTGQLALEALAVIMLASSFALLVLLCLFRALPTQVLPRALLLLSGTALLVTMTFALGYSIGRFTGWWSLSIPQMVQWHGWINALGFVLPALAAWNLTTPATQVQSLGIPFSGLPWRWMIKRDFFTRINAIHPQPETQPTGIVDRLSDYRRHDFDPAQVRSEITAFYEHTDSHALLVYPEWQKGFLTLARLYKRLSSAVGQMNFPLQPDSAETAITSSIVPIQDGRDGRSKVRGWIRVYTQTQQTVYVAAYAAHQYKGETYMNIAFPLPFGNLTSILRLEHMQGVDGGLSLTSYSTRTGDQGVYFASKLITIRLPINEIIEVYPARRVYTGYPTGFSRRGIVARHKMWLFGRHCLTLHYSITPC